MLVLFTNIYIVTANYGKNIFDPNFQEYYFCGIFFI